MEGIGLNYDNYVKGINKDGEIIITKIIETNPNGALAIIDGIFIHNEDLQPIPLTEEILLKCGFEVEQMGGYSTGKRIDFNVYRNRHLTFNTSQNQWWINSVANVSIKHLHQLQNLYFALTNEELIINL